MPTITCPQCGQSFDDAELFCPHCGAAQIPQTSRIELSRQQAEARRLPRGMKVGYLVGLIVAVMLLAAERLWWPIGGVAENVGMLIVTPMLGGVVGLLVQRGCGRAAPRAAAKQL